MQCALRNLLPLEIFDGLTSLSGGYELSRGGTPAMYLTQGETLRKLELQGEREAAEKSGKGQERLARQEKKAEQERR